MGQRLSTAVKLHKNKGESSPAALAAETDDVLSKHTSSQDQIDHSNSEIFIPARTESIERRRLSGVFVGDIRRDSIGSEGNSSLKIVLVPHEHTLFCERKERVCKSAGKLQEFEYLQIIGPLDEASNIVWMRSSEPDGGAGTTILFDTEGSHTYRLSVDDVGLYISFRADIGGISNVYHDFVGPILPGPARLLNLTIQGHFVVGNYVVATTDYIGGTEGPSQYWWMRVKNGRREQLSEPVEISATKEQYIEASSGILSNSTFAPSFTDSRFYYLTEKDVGCELKVKCRPCRSDGAYGEIFTSKATPIVSDVPSNILPMNASESVSTDESGAIAVVNSTNDLGTLL